MPTLARTIHFYDLLFLDAQSLPVQGGALEKMFQHVNSLTGKARVFRRPDRDLCAWQTRFALTEGVKLVVGELVHIRSKNISKVINLTDDTTRDLTLAVNEGLIEATHFAISYGHGTSPPRLAIEYNHFGPRVGDMKRLLEYHAPNAGLTDLRHVVLPPVVRDDKLREMIRRIRHVAKVRFRVVRDSLQALNQFSNSRLFSGLAEKNDFAKMKYAELTLAFDYAETSSVQDQDADVRDFLARTQVNPEMLRSFELLQIEAEDSDLNFRLENFDLLKADVRKDVTVETVDGYARVIDSSSMMAKLIDALLQNPPDVATTTLPA